jgi:sulfur-oxidizing protein SoxY
MGKDTVDAANIVTTRRRLLVAASRLAGGMALASLVKIDHPGAAEAELQSAIRKVVGESALGVGRVTLDLPPLVENGNSVPLNVVVESPMTAADHVKAIHIFNEKNPQPNVVSFHLGPRAGRANVSTRVRLSDSQKVVAIAELSDGSFWSGSADVIVTIAACTEDL